MFSAIAAAAALAAGQVAPDKPGCAGEANCAELTPQQMFGLADQLFTDGKREEAAGILRALTQDKDLETRSEARFRLAALLEQMGDLRGAADNLRALLAEEPTANPPRLELARILERMGETNAAKKELAKAEAVGLPPDVAINVRQFASRLAQATKRRGLTLEVVGGPDSNINRSTSSPFIDTIIAPFELSDDARRIGGFGVTGSARAYSRDSIGPITLMTRVNGRADLYEKSRFNDIQLSADSGPEFALGKARLRPSAILERRWYGGDLYAKGWGGDASLLAPLSSVSQVEFRASAIRQTIVPNLLANGWRTSFDGTYTQVLGPRLTGQLSLRHARLDAKDEAESLRTWGGSALLAYEGKAITLYGEAGLAFTRGVQPLFLFGEKRRDTRIDLSAGAIFTKARLGGFMPVARLSHTDSDADIVLWDYKRTRLDVGLTRSF